MQTNRNRLWRLGVLSLVVLPACEPSGDGAEGPSTTLAVRLRQEGCRECLRRFDEKPRDVDNLLRWGTLLLGLEQLDAALGTFQKAVSLAPDRVRGLELTAHALYALGRFGEAYEHYRRAAALGRPLGPVLERCRNRVGVHIAPRAPRPGLGELLQLVAPDRYREAATLAVEFERLRKRTGAPRGAVQRAVFSLVVEVEGAELPRRTFLLRYLAEVSPGGPGKQPTGEPELEDFRDELTREQAAFIERS